MPDRLAFADSRFAADALTFARRAAALTETGVRFQASDGLMAMTVAPLAPRGLFDQTPTVLVMRSARVDPELVCDIVVDATQLVLAADDDTAIQLPDTGMSPAWAGIAPPRTGWVAEAGFDAATLAARARWGIAAVAESVPRDAGEDVVRVVRAGIWGEPDESLGGQPLGIAFGAFVMGLIAGEENARVLRSGAWTRATLARGHVLVRGPARVGLTDVRTAGPR